MAHERLGCAHRHVFRLIALRDGAVRDRRERDRDGGLRHAKGQSPGREAISANIQKNDGGD